MWVEKLPFMAATATPTPDPMTITASAATTILNRMCVAPLLRMTRRGLLHRISPIGLRTTAVFEPGDHVQRERGRPRAVDDAVVERRRDVADLPDHDLAVADDGPGRDP